MNRSWIEMRRRRVRATAAVLVAAGILVTRVLAESPHEHPKTRQDEHAHEDAHEDEHAHEDEDAHEDEHAHEDTHEDAHDDAHGHDFTVADFQRFGVGVGTAAAATIDLTLELPGEVRPNADRIAHLAPRFPGIVREVRKRIGDPVRAGEVLAVIESENLSSFEMKAALDGVVIARHITPGEAALRERTAFIVADLSTVWVEVSVYQAALPRVAVHQPVRVSGRDGLEAEGAISYVAPIVDQATRAAAARVVLANPDGRWRPGLFVTVAVQREVEADLAVPRRALHQLEGDTVVFAVEGDRFVPRPVRLGAVGWSRAEIVAGLRPGDRYADEKSFLVKAELAKGEGGHAH